MKTAIIFGANGYLGRNFTHFLLGDGYQLQLFGLQEKSADNYPFYKKVNILDKPKLETINFNVDFVFIFSGLNGTTVGFDNYENFILTNEIGTLNILHQIKEQSCTPRVIFPSTRLIYKENDSKALDESAAKAFNSIYALNKFFCENVLQIYADVFGIKYNVFRIGVPYGSLLDNKYNYGTIAFFLSMAMRGEDITVYGDGLHKRTFTHVLDVIEATMQTITRTETVNAIYNIGGEALTLTEVAEAIASKTGVNVSHIEWPEIDSKIEVGNTVFNSTKLDQAIQYQYKHNFKNWAGEIKADKQ